MAMTPEDCRISCLHFYRETIGCWGKMPFGDETCAHWSLVPDGPMLPGAIQRFLKVIYPHHPIAWAHGNGAVSMNLCTLVIGPKRANDARCFTVVRNSHRQHEGSGRTQAPHSAMTCFPSDLKLFWSNGYIVSRLSFVVFLGLRHTPG